MWRGGWPLLFYTWKDWGPWETWGRCGATKRMPWSPAPASLHQLKLCLGRTHASILSHQLCVLVEWTGRRHLVCMLLRVPMDRAAFHQQSSVIGCLCASWVCGHVTEPTVCVGGGMVCARAPTLGCKCELVCTHVLHVSTQPERVGIRNMFQLCRPEHKK